MMKQKPWNAGYLEGCADRQRGIRQLSVWFAESVVGSYTTEYSRGYSFGVSEMKGSMEDLVDWIGYSVQDDKLLP